MSSARDLGFRFVYILTAIVMIVNLVFSVRDGLIFSLDDLPEGDRLYSVQSTNGATLTVYSVDNALGSAVRAEVELGGQTSTVYWQTGTTGADAQWLDEKIVEINGVIINVAAGGNYDCRHGYSPFQRGSMEGWSDTLE